MKTTTAPTHPELVLRRGVVLADAQAIEAGLSAKRERAGVQRAMQRFDPDQAPFPTADTDLRAAEADLAELRSEAEDIDLAIAVLEYRAAKSAMAPVTARAAEIVAELEEIAVEYAPECRRTIGTLPLAYQGLPVSEIPSWVPIAHGELQKHAQFPRNDFGSRATPAHAERVKRYRALQDEQGRSAVTSIPLERTVRDLEERFPTFRQLEVSK